MKRSTLLLLIAGLCLACNNKSDSDAANIASSNLTAKDLEAIKDLTRQELETIRNGDTAALFKLLSDDAEFLTPGQGVYRGEAARKWFRDFMEGYTVTTAPYSNEEVEVSGDLAYHRYSFGWTITPKAGGAPIQETGYGLHILKRGSDGSWMFIKDMWQPDPKPAANK